jgi:uncharacterized protein YjbK
MHNPTGNVEIEIKLNLGSFTNYLKLVGFLGNIDSEDRLVSAFFDTEDRRLAAGGWALRVRVHRDRGLVTVKGVPTETGSAVLRQEIEAEVPRSAALELVNLQHDVMSLSVEPVAFLTEKFSGLSLARLVRFTTQRQRKAFRIDEDTYVFEIDRTEFADGSVDYELEVELPDPQAISTVENYLRRLFTSLDIPFEKQGKSKLARALDRTPAAS